MRISRFLHLSCVVSLLSACGDGITEFQHYRVAFDAQYAEGTRVFDRLASAEQRLLDLERENIPRIAPFRPDEATAYLRVGDPPRTAATRASLLSLKIYNDAPSGRATGEAAEGRLAQAGLLAGHGLEAVARASSSLRGHFPTSPQLALLKGGEVAYPCDRDDIEKRLRPPENIAAEITAAFEEHCGPPRS